MVNAERINNFFKKSLSMIDSQDLDREFNESQLKYGAELLSKDMKINELNNQINTINNSSNLINSNTMALKNKLNTIIDISE